MKKLLTTTSIFLLTLTVGVTAFSTEESALTLSKETSTTLPVAAVPIEVHEVKALAAKPKKCERIKPKKSAPKVDTVKKKVTTESKQTSQQNTNTTKNTNATESSTSDTVSAIEKEVVRLVNIERSKQGLKPLTIDEKVSSVADKKSQDMKDKGYFDHQSPTYGSPFDMLRKFDVKFSSAGENIAAGQKTAAEVVKGWMNSEGHRANILNASYTHIGVGFVEGGSYGTYWTQLFIAK
ncbi:CAP domain-containing protein [Risungbinella massiliensis]|uniref:CAP domain-containing protein n=1 Tax=Risungbinella massiliensis TaxID=1329796 RepID=UPI00069AA72B|nr:CAP domain-containing protein [Risungbinella massiliensis]